MSLRFVKMVLVLAFFYLALVVGPQYWPVLDINWWHLKYDVEFMASDLRVYAPLQTGICLIIALWASLWFVRKQ